MAGSVVRIPVGAGRRDHYDAGGEAEPSQLARPTAEPDRRCLDDDGKPGLPELPELLRTALEVIQLIAGKQRTRLESVLVVVNPAERVTGDIPHTVRIIPLRTGRHG